MPVTSHPTNRPAHRNRKPEVKRVVRDFPPSSSAVPEARHWASGWARAWSVSAEAAECLALNVTELAANAVLHARSPFRVHLEYNGRRIRLEVEDASPEEPRELHASPEATAGRGFALVRALSRRAGVKPANGRGKRVWAELDA